MQTTANSGSEDRVFHAISLPVRPGPIPRRRYTPSSGGEVTLAERWNDTTWAVQATPSAADAATSEFDGLARSCQTLHCSRVLVLSPDAGGIATTLADHDS